MASGATGESRTVASIINRERLQRGGFYLSILVPLALAGIVLGGLFPVLVLGWTDPNAIEELGVHRFHVMGIAFFATLGLGLIVTQLYRPRDHPGALLAAAAVFAAAAVVQVITGEDPMLAVFFGGPAAVGLLLHPAGREMFDRKRDSPLLWVLAFAAAIPLVLFAVAQVNLQLTQPLADSHAEHGHYAMMANLGFALAIAGVVAASGLPGWRITAWFAGVGVTYFGIQSLAMPSQVGAVSTTWSALAIAWGIVFVVVAEYSRREDVSDLVSRS